MGSSTHVPTEAPRGRGRSNLAARAAAIALAIAVTAVPLGASAPQAQAAAAQEIVITPDSGKIVGLNLSRGVVRTVNDLEGTLFLSEQNIRTGKVPVLGRWTPPGKSISSAVRCAPGLDCVRAVDGNYYGVSYLIVSGGHTTLETDVAPGSALATRTPVPGIGGQVRDASPDFVVVDGGTPKRQYLVASDFHEVTRSRPVQAAAVWYETLWSASTSTPGTLIAELYPDRPTPRAPSRTVRTGVSCVPTELEATARWLYWSCGYGKQAGVYDLTKNRGFRVPSGQALLGDGYVVRHDRATGTLKLTDFHTGAPVAERTIATLPAGKVADERRITWAVDKYGGHIAYLDGAGRVHVMADGVPDSAPVIAQESSNLRVTPGDKYFGLWSDAIYLSRPVDSWQVQIANRITKRLVATSDGGAEPGPPYIYPSWNGKDPKGAVVDSGTYTWELTVKYGGGTLPVKVGSGVLQVDCGRLLTHVYDCDGIPDLLAIRTNGTTYSWTGLTTGTLRNVGHTATWPASSTLVPIGDLNGDRKADLLVRDSKGNVRIYWGRGDGAFAPSYKSTAISTGWNRYNVLTSPGDLTGDGRDDLVVRDTAGVLWLYPANSRSGYNTRIKIGSGQGGYTAMVGVGDLNGDGRGDLVARDAAGNLYRMLGANGRFGARVKIGAGFKAYNAIIGIGDLNQDGKNDLLTRDSAGNLYRYSGNGKGAISTKVKIGSGWNTYKKLV
ncbi:hypothetical protein GCM10023194_07430 [Planotetraspora phitsanulokensis]|uniref:VCBS repeat-containing protein n=1 Tax=Planotetraspora phitsanulokensis TaxID=575192 RepID=A0A8J3UB21_9ACTN|nr:FG-GAP-like repeat-containing protein [Planotetraspora phitsanulokensis]GII39239.1 hypothetical protein Pph01_42420 [Planotetraspora phitsanulokensis]